MKSLQLGSCRNQNTFNLNRTTPRNLSRWIWNTSSDPNTQNIFAAATPTNSKSALSIIKVDGPQASALYHQMTSAISSKKHSNIPLHQSKLSSRMAKLRRIVDPFTKETLDPEAIVINFPHQSTSITSTFEFHLHGSPAIIKSVILSLSRLPNFRVAQPGEFTQRRYERSVIQNQPEFDLNQLLALKNLIDAETDEQRKLAIHQFDGPFKQIYQSIRKSLLESMALCEAIIDFSEDGSIDDESVWEQVSHKVQGLQSIIRSHLNNSNRHEKVLNGIRLSLFGAPNVGKSTLLNWLVNREASIVSPHPGTTRDVIEISLDFHGFPIIVSDTAGLRDNPDPIEKIGIDRAKLNISKADLTFYLIPAPVFINSSPKFNLDSIRTLLHTACPPSLILVTKTDLVAPHLLSKSIKDHSILIPNIPICPISVKTLSGSLPFLDRLKILLETNYGICMDNRSNPILTSTIQRTNLQNILDHLDRFLKYREHEDGEQDLVIAIEELREAAWIIGRLMGDGKDEVEVEEVLGEIFRGFCIGK